MTHADWLAFRPDPDVLLRFLIGSDAPRLADVAAFPDSRASERKLRLFACACYHRLADLLPNPLARRAVDVAERFADGDADEAELAAIEAELFAAYDQQEGPWRAAKGADRARLAADHRALALALQVVRRPAPHAAWYASSNAYLAAPELLHPRAGVRDAVRAKAERTEKLAQVAILRCQFGPPVFGVRHLDPDGSIATAREVARQAYRERDWRALPVVADALEDAGCADADLLDHLRGPCPHVRGCWGGGPAAGERVAVTEQEWLNCTDPDPMLYRVYAGRAIGRKLRLLGCACLRRLWPTLEHEAFRQAVDDAERFADGRGTKAALRRARQAIRAARYALTQGQVRPDWAPFWLAEVLATENASGHVVFEMRRLSGSGELIVAGEQWACVCELIRELFGPLPFRPVTPAGGEKGEGTAARGLAEAAYEDRLLPSGCLDPDQLGVLGDALEDAGADVELVEHLRGPGPHVRGCWVVDLILGKE